jgi:hypothetical protein
LAASGAVAISIIERDGVTRIVTDHSKGKVARWWIASQDAHQVAAQARRYAGRDPDAARATAALHRAAAALQAVLTPDDVAIARAANAVLRLDATVEKMRRDGVLHEFNRRFRAGRAAALAEGRRFMSYRSAMARLADQRYFRASVSLA